MLNKLNWPTLVKHPCKNKDIKGTISGLHCLILKTKKKAIYFASISIILTLYL